MKGKQSCTPGEASCPAGFLNSLNSDKSRLLQPKMMDAVKVSAISTFPLYTPITSFLSPFLKDACEMKGCGPCLITVFRAWENLAAPQLFRERERRRREIALGIIVLRTNLTIHTWH